jgi:hypothetical protein
MSETDQFIGQTSDALIPVGLQTFRELPDWMMSARDPNRHWAPLCQAIPELQ